jgi:O-antigen ligase
MVVNPNYANMLLNISRISVIIAATAGTFSTALTSITTILMLICWLISGQALATIKISWQHPAGRIIVLFFADLLLSMLYSQNSLNVSFSTLWSWRKLFYCFILLGLFFSPYWKNTFINTYLISMAIALALSYLAWFEVIPARPGSGPGILAQNYTVQGMAFIVAVFCMIAMFNEVSYRIKVVYSLSIFAFAVNVLFLNPGRSGYLALLVGGLVAAIGTFGRHKIPHILAISILTMLTAVTFSETLQTRFQLGFGEAMSYEDSEKLTSIGTRVVFAENTLEIIKNKPVFGYGTGSFRTEYQNLVKTKYNDWRATPTSDPHNQYLYILVENGLVGLAIFIYLIVVIFRRAIHFGTYGIIGASILSAWTISSLFNSHFKTFHEGHLLGLFLGAMLSGDMSKKSANN